MFIVLFLILTNWLNIFLSFFCAVSLLVYGHLNVIKKESRGICFCCYCCSGCFVLSSGFVLIYPTK